MKGSQVMLCVALLAFSSCTDAPSDGPKPVDITFEFDGYRPGSRDAELWLSYQVSEFADPETRKSVVEIRHGLKPRTDEHIASSIYEWSRFKGSLLVFLEIVNSEKRNWKVAGAAVERVKALIQKNASPDCRVGIVVLPQPRIRFQPPQE